MNAIWTSNLTQDTQDEENWERWQMFLLSSPNSRQINTGLAGDCFIWGICVHSPPESKAHFSILQHDQKYRILMNIHNWNISYYTLNYETILTYAYPTFVTMITHAIITTNAHISFKGKNDPKVWLLTFC